MTKNNVTVTAPGLTDLTVAVADAPAIDTAAEGKVVAYDVTPATASGSYKKNGTVTPSDSRGLGCFPRPRLCSE